MSTRAATHVDEAKPLDRAQLLALVQAAQAERDRHLQAEIARVARTLARFLAALAHRLATAHARFARMR